MDQLDVEGVGEDKSDGQDVDESDEQQARLVLK